MKTLLVCAGVAVGLFATSAMAAGGAVSGPRNQCSSWNLSQNDLSACNQLYSDARDDNDHERINARYNPNYRNASGGTLSPADDARESLGSGSQRNTGATGRTGDNVPQGSNGSVIDPQPMGQAPHRTNNASVPNAND